MKAVVTTDFNKGSVMVVDDPVPANEEVLIEISRVQLSITECMLYRGEKIYGHNKVKKQIQQGDGRAFGHEFCGVVREAGSKVTELSVGDRVYAPAKISCQDCSYCSSGYTELCNDKETIGLGRPGALAEKITVPARILRRLPDEVNNIEGAAMQPLASTTLCVHDADIKTGQTVVVMGCGAMGYAAGQLALEMGASRVFAVDILDRKLELAEQRGMEPINATETDPVNEIRTKTNQVGADLILSAVGGNQSHATTGDDPLAQAFRMVRTGGTIVQVGHIIGSIEIEPIEFRSKSVTWVNPRTGVLTTGPNTDTGGLAPQLVASNRVSIEEHITHEYDGLDSFETAIDATLNKERYDALGPAQLIVNES